MTTTSTQKTEFMCPEASARSVVVIDPSQRLLDAAQDLKMRVLILRHPDNKTAYELTSLTSLYSVDYTVGDLSDFVRRVLAPAMPACVVALSERGALPGATIRGILGLGGATPATVRMLQDKAFFRTELARRDLNDFSLVSWTGEDVLAGRVPVDADLIVKPRFGTASSGVRRMAGAEVALLSSFDDLVIEEFLDGPEYSAEVYTSNGVHEIVAITEKVVDVATFVELGHVTPPRGLGGSVRGTVERQLAHFLTTMGITTGPSHTEFKIISGQIKIIESHCRVGGDGITMLALLSTGIDLIRKSVRQPIGEATPRIPAVANAAAIAFQTSMPGVVTEVQLPWAEAECLGDSVHDLTSFVSVGDSVFSLASSSDRVGCAIVTSQDAESALSAAGRLASLIRVRTCSES